MGLIFGQETFDLTTGKLLNITSSLIPNGRISLIAIFTYRTKNLI